MQTNNTCPDSIEEGSGSRTKSSTKRRSTRSRVLEKVAWFTKKGKGGKETVTCSGEHGEQCPGLEIKNRSDRERRRANTGCENCQGTFNENSFKIKDKRRGARKTGSFCYLKKRKARQLKHDACDGPFEETTAPSSALLQDTATGTFHDFTSERVRVKQGSNVVLNEIARGIQESRSDSKGNVQSALLLPLGDLSMTEKSIKHSESLKRHDSGSASSHKSSPSVWRSCSFSGASYNSWPRKNKSSLGNLSVDTLSPPQKQKRLPGLKKTATFSGFDSSRINIKETCRALFKGVKSTPHLPDRSQIKDQEGSTVGVIHFYKSPKDGQSSSTSSQHAKQSAHLLKSDKDLSLHQTSSCDPRTENVGSQVQLGNAGSYPKLNETSTHSINVNTNSQQESQFCDECPTDSPVECSELMCLEADAADSVGITLPSCKILGARLLDSFNVYNVTTLSCVSQCDNNGRGSWSDNQDEQSTVTEEQEQSTTKCLGGDLSDSIVEPSVKGVTFQEPSPTEEQQTCDCLKAGDELMIKQTMPDDTSVISCDSLGFVTDLHTTSNPELSPESDKVTHHSSTPCLEDGRQSVGCQTELPEHTVCHASMQTSPSNDKPSDVNLTGTYAGVDIDDKCLPECSSVMRECNVGVHGERELCDSVENGYERTSVKSVSSEKQTHGVELHTAEYSTRPALSGRMFKQHLEVILQYFHEFNDEQKNIVIRRLLGDCGVPQMHMLSVAIEPVLHQNCPPNCQDMLSWLPSCVAFNVLSYLDAVSLCRCDQVNKLWNDLVSNPVLWKRLCRIPDWQLSRSSEDKQLLKYRSADGTIQWKKVFAERFLLRQNWLNGSCKVRTFKGHTQGISCIQFDDSRIASGSSDKTIKVWDTDSADSNAVLTLAGHSATVRCLNLNGNRLVSGSVDRSIKVWDLSFESYWSGASCKVTLLGHMHTVRCLQVDNDKVVSGSYDKTLKVWDIKTGHCRFTLRGHNAAVLCVQFDDRKIVSGSYDKTIKVWSLDEGLCLMTLTGHHDAVTCVNLTFDSRKVISGSLDHNLKFWDLATGKSVGTLDWIRSEGHTGVVRCLQSDSWRIVSAGDDKTMKMWSLETGQRLLTLRCHTDGVTCLQFNDFRIVSGSYDQTVKLWNFAPSHDFLSSE